MSGKYAMTDNLYSLYRNGKENFHHIFLPNPTSGRNSALRMKGNNEFFFPYRKYRMFDRTKEYFYAAKDVIWIDMRYGRAIKDIHFQRLAFIYIIF